VSEALVLDAAVTPPESAVVQEAARLLTATLGQACPLEVRLRAPVQSGGSSNLGQGGPRVVLLSLSGDVFALWPVAAAARYWHALLPQFADTGATAVFLLTVSRHVGGVVPHRYFEAPEPLVERIRRFNMLAYELSHAHGAFVVDLDRAVADVGAADLQTDCRLAGPAAVRLGGLILASTLLRAGFDERLPVEAQEAALQQLEADRQALDWPGLRRYRLRLATLSGQLRQLQAQAAAGHPDRVRQLAEFLLRSSEQLRNVDIHGVQAQHRELLAAYRDSGQQLLALCGPAAVRGAEAERAVRDTLLACKSRLDAAWQAWDRTAVPTGSGVAQ